MARLPRRISDYGPSALLLDWEPKIDPAINRSVHAFAALLNKHPAVLECVASYASLLVRFASPKISAYNLREFIFAAQIEDGTDDKAHHHDLPVCYHLDFAPDLREVITTLKTNAKTLIKRHTSPTYLVYQIGYQPGFGFLGQTDKRLTISRRSSPRRSLPAGSVGLAGRQTGVYPAASPGGWQLIGRCPVPLLRAGNDPARLRPGDTVRFHAIPKDEFLRYDPNSAPWPLR